MSPEDCFKTWANASLAQLPSRWVKSMPEAMYHAHPGINASSLKEKTTREMRHALTYPKKGTYAKTLGSAFHKALLEPDLFDSEGGVEEWFQYSPTIGLDSKAALSALAAWPDKPLVTPDIIEKARRLRDCVYAHHEARRILECKSQREVTGFAWDEQFQCMRKIRIDFRPLEPHPVFGEPFLTDIKMVRDISETGFWGQLKELQYHLSAGYYVDTDAMIEGTLPRPIFSYITATGPTGQNDGIRDEPYMARVFDIGGLEGDISLIDQPETGGREMYYKKLNMLTNAIRTWTWEAYENEPSIQLTSMRPFTKFKKP